MNKKILFLLAMIILVVGLVACGDKKEPKYDASGNPIATDKTSDKGKDKPVDETNPYVANIPNEIIDFYKEKVEEVEKQHRANQAELLELDPNTDISQLTNLKYDLVFFDDNNTPELVVTNPGMRTALYTYDAGKVIYTMEEGNPDDVYGWPYGVAGNAGYEYIPRGNVIRWYANDYAGLIRYTCFWKLDETSHILVDRLEDSLYEVHYEDKNGNGNVDEDEMEYIETPIYHLGDKVLTQEEFDSYLIPGDYEELAGTKSYSEMIAALDSLINQK